MTGEVAERTEVLGDSAYGTGDLLDKINKNGWTATIKPHPLRPAVEGGFTLDDFAYDEQAGTADLPEPGHPPAVEDPDRDLRQDLCWLSAAGAVHHLGDGSQRSS